MNYPDKFEYLVDLQLLQWVVQQIAGRHKVYSPRLEGHFSLKGFLQHGQRRSYIPIILYPSSDVMGTVRGNRTMLVRQILFVDNLLGLTGCQLVFLRGSNDLDSSMGR